MKNYGVKKSCKFHLLMMFCLMFLQWQSLYSQKVSKDTSQTIVVKDVDIKEEDGELVLEVIEIKGYVDKPGVTIIPKRVEPEMEEREIDRSFDKEVKQGVGEIPMPDEALRRVDRVESIKKTVAKKRK